MRTFFLDRAKESNTQSNSEAQLSYQIIAEKLVQKAGNSISIFEKIQPRQASFTKTKSVQDFFHGSFEAPDVSCESRDDSALMKQRRSSSSKY